MNEIDDLFNEPYGIDDSIEILRMIYNPAFDFKKSLGFSGYEKDAKKEDIEKEYIDFIKTIKEKIELKKIFDIHLSNNGVYLKHYRIHSVNAFNVLYLLSFFDSEKIKRKYLEEKIVNFFKSYEWETWAWKYIENLKFKDS